MRAQLLRSSCPILLTLALAFPCFAAASPLLQSDDETEVSAVDEPMAEDESNNWEEQAGEAVSESAEQYDESADEEGQGEAEQDEADHPTAVEGDVETEARPEEQQGDEAEEAWSDESSAAAGQADPSEGGEDGEPVAEGPDAEVPPPAAPPPPPPPAGADQPDPVPKELRSWWEESKTYYTKPPAYDTEAQCTQVHGAANCYKGNHVEGDSVKVYFGCLPGWEGFSCEWEGEGGGTGNIHVCTSKKEDVVGTVMFQKCRGRDDW